MLVQAPGGSPEAPGGCFQRLPGGSPEAPRRLQRSPEVPEISIDSPSCPLYRLALQLAALRSRSRSLLGTRLNNFE